MERKPTIKQEEVKDIIEWCFKEIASMLGEPVVTEAEIAFLDKAYVWHGPLSPRQLNWLQVIRKALRTGKRVSKPKRQSPLPSDFNQKRGNQTKYGYKLKYIEWASSDEHLTKGGLKLLIVLYRRYQVATRSVVRSIAELAAELKVSDRSISRFKSELEGRGYCKCQHTNGGRNQRTRFVQLFECAERVWRERQGKLNVEEVPARKDQPLDRAEELGKVTYETHYQPRILTEEELNNLPDRPRRIRDM